MGEVVTRDGTRLRVEEAGQGETTALLLHGMACRLEDMGPLVDALAPRMRCVSVDQRGHGGSDAPRSTYSMTELFGDIEDVCTACGIDRPVLVGHSFGGSISLAYTARHPERVRALVLLDSGMRSASMVQGDLGPFYRALDEADDDGYRAILGDFIRRRLVDVPVDGEALAVQVTDVMSRVPRHVFLSMSRTVEQMDRAADARACTTVPALLVQSRQAFVDPTVLPDLGENWHVAKVVGSGHFVQLVVPDQTNAMVQRFLDLVL